MTESAAKSRVHTVAIAWVVAIAVGTLILPAGGLVVAVVAALTTYKSSARVRTLILVAGLLTVALQVTPSIMIYRHLDSSVTEVKLP